MKEESCLSLEKRYSIALSKLSHQYLLGLPQETKEQVWRAENLEEEVRILEELVDKTELLKSTSDRG